ncbi:hypothetical protein PIB30_053736 [Stylosanthes scabra]|uniref:Uncharacterized protein n=1 Tax=Stylosanthes scabra TaxID=79078 RepID=A0ABU6XK56_9FABA|nr:hypothetical protein [Stylosanthes scabra]
MDSRNQVCEALGFINGGDDEVMEINGDLLMSLMDESSLVDDHHHEAESDDDQDRLNSLIRSFEAEIASGTNNKKNSESLDQSWTMTTGHVEGQDYYLASSKDDEFGVEWVNMDFMPSSPSDHHDNSWCIDDPYYYDDGVLDVENSLKEYEGYAMEEQNECNNNSFWQESYYNLVR